MAWLSTVRPDGQPVTVPVWFLLQEDETLLLYSQPTSSKLRNLSANPKVSLVLDMCDLGRNIVRIEGIAKVSYDQSPADEEPAYVAKYLERIGALFGTPERFAGQFSSALIITPVKVLIQ